MVAWSLKDEQYLGYAFRVLFHCHVHLRRRVRVRAVYPGGLRGRHDGTLPTLHRHCERRMFVCGYAVRRYLLRRIQVRERHTGTLQYYNAARLHRMGMPVRGRLVGLLVRHVWLLRM